MDGCITRRLVIELAYKKSDGMHFQHPENIHLQTYLRLLQLAPPKPAVQDWWAAAELIAAGHATGIVGRESDSGLRKINRLYNFAPTLQGRLFADELRQMAYRSSDAYRQQEQRLRRRGQWSGAAWAAIPSIFAGVAVAAITRFVFGC